MTENGRITLVFDCGATNLKVVAVNSDGEIAAHASSPNSPSPQRGGNPGWLIWDLEEIWRKLCLASREVLGKIDPRTVSTVIVATWGADGAPVRKDGSLTYPPISWQCPRTAETAKRIEERISSWEIFRITGYQITPFNTLLRLIWLRENAPEALDEAYTWLMMPGLITFRLCGEFHIEPTSASTMMAMDLKRRDWSDSLLELAGLDPGFFPEWTEPGVTVGYVTEEAERRCGVPSGVPVAAGGHDTQFALFGSGARIDEAILSSGTWEILGVRSDTFNPTRSAFENGLLFEADVQPGYWNPQLLMMGSGVLEWLLDKVYPEGEEKRYELMIREAEKEKAGSEGVMFIPSFVKETGPSKKYGTLGTILGLTLRTSRGQLIRSALESLSFQLRHGLEILQAEVTEEIRGIRVVGGGSRNPLWNQIRVNVTGLPVVTTEQKEYTALGAAITRFIEAGTYRSLEDARRRIFSEERVFRPDADAEVYEELFRRYKGALEALREYYS
jgi:L-fuculokinase